MRDSQKIALVIVAMIIVGSLIGVIISQRETIIETENQKIYDKGYVDGYNKGFTAGCEKTIQTMDSIRNSNYK